MLPFPSFSFEAPDRLEEALSLLRTPGSLPVAGGTDLLPSMKHRLFTPELVVSLKRIPAMRSVEHRSDGTLALGAMLTLREVSRLAAVQDHYAALAAACGTIATPTIQTMGTLGGNVMLDTRCMYYNQPAGWRGALGFCLKKDGTRCHVAPKGNGCYAAHSADTVPSLWQYGASLEVASADGPREIAIRDLYADDGLVRHVLTPGTLVTRILLPPPRGRVVHRKLRARGAIDYALLLVAVAGETGRLTAVLSAIGPRPIEVEGSTPEALAEAAFKASQPLSTHLQPSTWRKRMVRVEVRRAAEQLLTAG